jgi:CubicO group peptidase (beta-lactamase class C family)
MIIAGSAAVASSALAPAPAAASGLRISARLIDSAAAAAIAAHACPGLQVAIAQSGNNLLSRAYGLANLEARMRMSTRSIFRIASLTKQFTAAAIIKLSSTGALRLDAPVSQYLPFMRVLPAMTLLELMHHTAGLHSDETNPPEHLGAAEAQVVLAEEVARQTEPLDFEPGSAWLYSNANYVVLGAVIEAVTGKPFAQAMLELVLAPLGLEATAVDHASDVVGGRVSGYRPVDAASAPFQHADLLEVSDAGGAGAMRSTALDLCRWHAALLSGRLFGQSEIELMRTPGRLRDGRLSGANRFSPEDARYGEVQYACGLLVSPPSEPHPSLLHYGYISGFACMLQTFTDDDVTLAVLCNADVGPATPFRAIRQVVIDALRGE